MARFDGRIYFVQSSVPLTASSGKRLNHSDLETVSNLDGVQTRQHMHQLQHTLCTFPAHGASAPSTVPLRCRVVPQAAWRQPTMQCRCSSCITPPSSSSVSQVLASLHAKPTSMVPQEHMQRQCIRVRPLLNTPAVPTHSHTPTNCARVPQPCWAFTHTRRFTSHRAKAAMHCCNTSWRMHTRKLILIPPPPASVPSSQAPALLAWPCPQPSSSAPALQHAWAS